MMIAAVRMDVFREFIEFTVNGSFNFQLLCNLLLLTYARIFNDFNSISLQMFCQCTFSIYFKI